MTGAEQIAAERQRQIDVEGWTPEHDAGHRPGYLCTAALSYAEVASEKLLHPWWDMVNRPAETRSDWPWGGEWWKPSEDPIRNLVKAGALIAAELDRLAEHQEGRS